jgi:phospholipid transport system substrate-binding protein
MQTISIPRNSDRAVLAMFALCAALLLAAAAPMAQAQAQAKAPAAAAPARNVDTSGPSQLIESAANIMLTEISARRAEFRKDPTGLYKLVDDVLLPHFDVNHAARLVLGRHWASATPQQRQRFVDAFYRSMLNNYGDALVDFTGDRIKVLPYKGDPAAKTASVRTTVKRSNGQLVPVNYSLRLTDKGWKAWDVVIEGISYVKSFREDFGAEIDQKGIDAVIQRLEAQRVAKQAA